MAIDIRRLLKGRKYMLKTQDIRIRDPYIVYENDKYYMYSSNCVGGEKVFGGEALAVVVYESTDLENWTEPKVVFSYTPTEESWIQADLWAPEVHKYNGKFYAFLSLKSKTPMRGTFIAVSDTPDGKFELLSEKPQTPEEFSCIDGTLHIENGTPYMIFSRDWIENYVPEKQYYMGEIWAMQLSQDLSKGVGEPFKLFDSKDSPLSAIAPNVTTFQGKTYVRYGSDAPYIKKLKDGRLLLTWSPMLKDTYTVLTAVSNNGSIKGEWVHGEVPLFADNGGHAMFFTDKDGQERMCIHCPERQGQERALILKVSQTEKGLVLG